MNWVKYVVFSIVLGVSIFKGFVLDLVFSIDTGGLSGCLTAVSALFVPIAILIYQDFRKEHAYNEFEWDKTVLLREVIKGWQILVAILLSSVAIIFWNYQNIWIKIFLLLLFFVGIIILVVNLIHLYKWFMSNKVGGDRQGNYRQSQKLKFLNKLIPDSDSSLDVWNDLFSSIEPGNIYLNDYMKIFLDKFSNSNDDWFWKYDYCLAQNMKSLHYQSPGFQDAIMEFVFDAYVAPDSQQHERVGYKRAIIQKLATLLIESDSKHYFAISRIFDERLSSIESGDVILRAVRDFSFDVLQGILSVYDDISIEKYGITFEIFPIDRWNVLNILDKKNDVEYMKATGLFITYLYMLPSYVDCDNGVIKKERGVFLDKIVFGASQEKLSMKMIRIVNLYFFGRRIFSSYENEETNHALIRSFIDNDYKFFFMEAFYCETSFINPNESEEQRIKQQMMKYQDEVGLRDKNTFELLTRVYIFLLDTVEMKKIKKAIDRYDLKDKKYKYKTEEVIIESNLDDLKTIIDKIVKFGKILK